MSELSREKGRGRPFQTEDRQASDERGPGRFEELEKRPASWSPENEWEGKTGQNCKIWQWQDQVGSYGLGFCFLSSQ